MDVKLPKIPLSFNEIPDRLDDDKISALWEPKHHFKDSLFFSMLMIVFNGIGCMFEVVVLLQKKNWGPIKLCYR